MNRAAKQMHVQLLTGVAVLFGGGLLLVGEMQLLTWCAEWIHPGSVERDGNSVSIGGGLVGVVANTLIVLGFVLVAGGLVWTIYFWRYKCPQCGARAKQSGKSEVFLECTSCDYREATGFFRE